MCSSFLYLWSEVPAFTVCIENAATAAEIIDNFIVKNATEEGVHKWIHLLIYLNEFASRCGCEDIEMDIIVLLVYYRLRTVLKSAEIAGSATARFTRIRYFDGKTKKKRKICSLA